MKPRIGRRYRLRNGAIVKVTGMRALPTSIDGRPGAYPLLVGHYVGAEDQLVSWELSGRYSPIAGASNGLDIMGVPHGKSRKGNPARASRRPSKPRKTDHRRGAAIASGRAP